MLAIYAQAEPYHRKQQVLVGKLPGCGFRRLVDHGLEQLSQGTCLGKCFLRFSWGKSATLVPELHFDWCEVQANPDFGCTNPDDKQVGARQGCLLLIPSQ